MEVETIKKTQRETTLELGNLRIVGIEESKDYQLKGPANIFNKIIEELS